MINNSKKYFLGIFLGLFFWGPISYANGLTISSPVVQTIDTTNDTMTITFNVTWNNSWRDESNYDAVWIIGKYLAHEKNVSGDSGNINRWRHMLLKSTGNSGGTAAAGSTVELVLPSDRTGIFLQRALPGTGTMTLTSVTLAWDYGAANLTDVEAQNTELYIFGLEMVFIPEGSFFIGDGNNGANYEFEDQNSSSSRAHRVTSPILFFANDCTSGSQDCAYYNSSGASGESSSGAEFVVAPLYPNGYDAFYIMKYEISQGLYTDFLNLIPASTQENRVASTLGTSITNTYVMTNTSTLTNRNVIQAPGSNNANTVKFYCTRPDRAMNYMSWMDFAAITDWLALRPMTELEYEKASRGPLSGTANDGAYGATRRTITNLSGTEDGTEYVSSPSPANTHNTSSALTGGDAGTGPVRVGIFAAGASNGNRDSTGASFYGVLDLSGNVSELVVTVGNSTGRGFAGSHGNGEVTYSGSVAYTGLADIADWPGYDTNYNVNSLATGSGTKGGSWASSSTQLQTSVRTYASTAVSTRQSDVGGRGVRSLDS